MNNHNEGKWLKPLKERPDLEPNSQFARELKSSLTNINVKPKSGFSNFRIILPLSLSVLLFSIITISYVGSNDKIPEQGQNTSEIEKSPVETEEEVSFDFEKLIDENPVYKGLYDEVLAVIKAEEPSKNVVFFFEALRMKNKSFLEEHAFFVANKDKEIPLLLESYKDFDFTSIKVDYIVPSQGEPSFEIVFDYKMMNDPKKYKNSIHLNFIDEKKAKIYDPLEEFNAKAKLEDAIGSKVVEIERKMKFGMSKDEAVEMFGNEFKEVVPPFVFEDDGTAEVWTYSYFVADDYLNELDNTIVDTFSLQSQKIGVILHIGWSAEGKALRMNMYYGRDGRVFTLGVDENGLSEEEITPEGKSYDDLELTEKAQEIYDTFKKNHDVEPLKYEDPFTIALMYIKANIERDQETAYALYTTREDRVMWSKEEDKEYWEKEQTSLEEIKELYTGIGMGTFNETSDYEGYISFRNKNGEQGFQMIMDESGVWKVGFMPIQ